MPVSPISLTDANDTVPLRVTPFDADGFAFAGRVPAADDPFCLRPWYLRPRERPPSSTDDEYDTIPDYFSFEYLDNAYDAVSDSEATDLGAAPAAPPPAAGFALDATGPALAPELAGYDFSYAEDDYSGGARGAAAPTAYTVTFSETSPSASRTSLPRGPPLPDDFEPMAFDPPCPQLELNAAGATFFLPALSVGTHELTLLAAAAFPGATPRFLNIRRALAWVRALVRALCALAAAAQAAQGLWWGVQVSTACRPQWPLLRRTLPCLAAQARRRSSFVDILQVDFS